MCAFGMKISIKVFYKLILLFWVYTTRHTQSTQNKFACLSNIPRKAWEIKLIFCLQINTSFLQVDNITMGVFNQACPRYPKQQVYNIFAISERKCEEWSWFFAFWQTSRFFQSDAVILGVWPGMRKLTKITSLPFLYNIVRNK